MKIAGYKKLLISQADSLYFDKPDVNIWYNYYQYKFVPKGAIMIDRTEQIIFPFRFESKFPIPAGYTNFNKSYKDVCLETASYYLNLSKLHNIPICVLWSGGIDSTAVMASFVMAGAKKENLVVALNNYSIIENFKFYHSHIRGKFDIVSSEGLFDLFNKQYMVIGGEGNDQLFGEMGVIYNLKRRSKNIDVMFEKHNEKLVTEIYETIGLSTKEAKFWYSLISNHYKKYNIEVKRVIDLFWWFNFSLKWQNMYYRIITRLNRHMRDSVNDEFCSKYIHQFFMNDDFQRWSMVNPDKKITNTFGTYKLASKEFIYEFDKNKDYFENKLKYGSLGKVFEHRVVPDGLTTDFEFIDKINPHEFYVEDNTFSKY